MLCQFVLPTTKQYHNNIIPILIQIKWNESQSVHYDLYKILLLIRPIQSSFALNALSRRPIYYVVFK